MTLKEGVVVRAVSGVYTVDDGERTVHCLLRGNLKKVLEFTASPSGSKRVSRVRRLRTTDPIAVGDRVRFAETRHGQGIIEEVLPRHSMFVRAGFRGMQHTVVSNIDQVMIVFACAEPRPDPWKLDRFLVAAELEGLAPFIIANKVDLVPEEEFRAQFEPFTSIGYAVIPASAVRGDGVDEVRRILQNRITAFVGPSGVGKSSLLNAIQPGLKLRTGEIGAATHKGRHTTTMAQLIPLRFGGWVADTPGMRRFDLVHIDPEDLVYGFPEMVPLLGKCRFADCQHIAEPDCAIRQAAESGTVQRRRYESYRILHSELQQRPSL
ncbi:MAG: ribosome small subunit-dependent GTPase A [Chthonomonadales bacterium]